MKNIFYKLLTPLTLAMALVACRKDATLTYLDVVDFPAGLTTSATNIELTKDNDDLSVVTFSWPAVEFKIKAPVTYALQISTPADTIGASAWTKAIEVAVGSDALSKSFQGNELNALVLDRLGLVQDSAHKLVARVVATLDRDVYSNAVPFTVKAYKNTALNVLYVPGDYQSWNPATALTIREVAGRPKMYEGYINMPGAGQGFKYTSDPDWNHTNYGNVGTGGLTNDGLAGNLNVPEGGYIYLTADLNTNKWTATKTTWGIIGDATPTGWTADTPMTYDPVAKVWKVTANLSSAGSFKFRANGAWLLNFGIDAVTKELMYADNPFLGYTPNLLNLSVPETGNYTVTLDLHNPGQYTYELKKN